MKDIYLLRHGQSQSNAEGFLAGRMDVPLTEKGEEQAVDAGKRLGDWQPDRILSSPLQRAADTARLAVPSQEIELVPGLMETNFGKAEGKTFVELQAENLDIWLQSTREQMDAHYEEGESMRMVYQRVIETIPQIIGDETTDEKILIVAHWGSISSLLAYWVAGQDEGMTHFSCGNARLSRVQVFDGFGVLTELNV